MSKLTRRRFVLAGVGTAGVLGIGWLAAPPRQRLVAGTPPDGPAGSHRLNGWVTIGVDDSVTVSLCRMEMGQGISTGIAMLLAEELDADMDRVSVVPAFDDRIYNNQAIAAKMAETFDPRQEGRLLAPVADHLLRKLARELPGLAITGASTSIRDQWLPMREAGASARQMLRQAAAREWSVPVGECRTTLGRVVHASGRSLSYGQLAEAAAGLPLPGSVRLKTPPEFRLIGTPLPQINAASKADGTAVYAMDLMPDGLLYAAARLCPVLGGAVQRVDKAAAEALPGVAAVVVLDPQPGGMAGRGHTAGGVAVVASTPHGALRGLERLAVDWNPGDAAGANSAEVIGTLRRALDSDEATVLYQRGDVDAALRGGGTVVGARYEVPFLAHAAMEPMNCTVRFDRDSAEVWVGCQGPAVVRGVVAEVLGLEPERVRVHPQLMGGGFGRKTFTDCIAQAAQIARAVPGRAVQLMWTREQDMTHGYYRPAMAARCEAVVDTSGRVNAWHYRLAGSSMGQPALMTVTRDGASDIAYEFDHMRVQHAMLESPVPVGIWRSVAHSFNAFFVESFMDELAATTRTDAVAFRRAQLAGKRRQLNVLDTAAKLAGWGKPLPPAPDGAPQALGLALHASFGSVVAQVARVSLGPERRIRVHEVTCVVDCGLAVNPNLVRQQMEGGIVYGLSAALHGRIDIEGGQVRQSNFDGYPPLRMNECPAIQTHIVASSEPPEGVGEVSTPPIAAAVSNAVFALTGMRLRRLPLSLA
ncbi:xanthine dehydrogenase family protein molybdopterin-binding subunit [Hydrogenophaga crocea]|uniref:Xanthine dehydrogenase family protein molybdopterin-binding subunit n=1 Tax=Hydrogenophaga crocea TaxID=2716225 RepID=A0A6G8IBZ7_9BURK|nr:molybdopterin cofactor-binding domain-containing protein [Hydrogenophaga crocea]QIM50663.1 xanthine dehydrogenase family protein molybdopterin-binding subunit [Hydrogenophaga crocea]